MAEYAKGVNYTKQNDPTSANIIDPGLLGGKLRVMQDTFSVSVSTNLNSTDYILVGGKLPTGAQVVKIILGNAGTSTLGTNSQVDVGDEGDQNRYIENVGISSASVQVGPNISGGQYYTVTGTTDNYIRVTGTEALTIVSANSLKISVFYTVE